LHKSKCFYRSKRSSDRLLRYISENIRTNGKRTRLLADGVYSFDMHLNKQGGQDTRPGRSQDRVIFRGRRNISTDLCIIPRFICSSSHLQTSCCSQHLYPFALHIPKLLTCTRTHIHTHIHPHAHTHTYTTFTQNHTPALQPFIASLHSIQAPSHPAVDDGTLLPFLCVDGLLHLLCKIRIHLREGK